MGMCISTWGRCIVGRWEEVEWYYKHFIDVQVGVGPCVLA